MQPAAVIELPYPEDVIAAALKDYLSRKGKSKVNDLKGFTTYRNTQPTQNGTENADLYFRIDRKSKQEKETSTVYLLLTPIEGTTSNLHSLNMEEAKTYLNELVTTIEGYNLEQKIKEQNKMIIDAEAKHKRLLNDGFNLERKRLELIQKISDNQLQQQAQGLEVQNQKQKLAEMVSRRKS
jgi:hypothetical protein